MPIFGKNPDGSMFTYTAKDVNGKRNYVTFNPAAFVTGGASGVRSHLVMASENEAKSTGFVDAVALTHAQAFDLIAVQMQGLPPSGPYVSHYTAAQITAMKALNPGLQIIAYTNAGEATGVNPGTRYADALYAHDVNGNKIVNSGWTPAPWPMQADNPDWIATHIALGQARMTIQDSGGNTVSYDGEFADVMGDSTQFLGAAIPGTATKYQPTQWYDLTKVAAADIVAANPGKMVLPNGLGWGTKYLNRGYKLLTWTGGPAIAMAEGFVRTALQTADIRDGTKPLATATSPGQDWLNELAMLAHASKNGKKVICMCKDWTAGTDDTVKTGRLQFGFATYLLANDGTHYFNSSKANDPTVMQPMPWLSNTDYGAPLGPYTVDSSTGVYFRSFTKCTIAVNPTTASHTVSVAGQTVTIAPARAFFAM